LAFFVFCKKKEINENISKLNKNDRNYVEGKAKDLGIYQFSQNLNFFKFMKNLNDGKATLCFQ
jgi:hypothetical protein